MTILQEKIPNVGTSTAPAWTAMDGGKTLLAWKGEGTDAGIYWATTSSAIPNPTSGEFQWTAQRSVPNVATSAGPALAFFQGTVFMAWKGEGSDTGIYWSKLVGGTTWAPQQKIPGGTSNALALAAANGALFLALKGESDERIFWSKSADGKTWTAPQLVSGAGGTSDTPALCAHGDTVYLAWKAEAEDQQIFWSSCADGKTWATQQPVPTAGGTSTGPALAVDKAGSVVLAWKAKTGDQRIFCTSLANEATNTWKAQEVRVGVATSERPALAALAGTVYMAWKGENTDPTIWYGELFLPPQNYRFSMVNFQIKNTRSGNIFSTSKDTDYAALSIALNGAPPKIQTQSMGDLSNGTYPTTIGVDAASIADTDTVVLSYHIVNSSQGETQATAYLQQAAEKIATAAAQAAAKAVGEAIGAAIGAILGTAIPVPLLGSALGALAGFLVGDAWGIAFPNCDGPVASAVHIYSGADLRAMTQPGGFILGEDNPGVNSPSGCGSNSDYVVTWGVSIG